MTKNEIKKILYKEKPWAKRYAKKFTKDVWLYECETSIGRITFNIPVDDMGEKIFDDEIPAQLLIRWLE